MPKPFEVKLRLVAFRHRLRSTRVMVLRELGEINIDGEKLSLEKGVEIEVPLWLATLLTEKGYVNIVEQPITIEDIARVHFSTVSAKTPADLEPLPKGFYLEALRYIESLDKQIRREFNAMLLEERQKATQYLLEIIDKRLLLILQSMRSPTSLAEISSKLTDEESILLEELRDDVEKWKKALAPPSL